MQINLEFAEVSQEEKLPTLNTADFGKPLRPLHATSASVYMRVKPINWLLNSTLVCTVINRGDVFLINLHTGTLWVAKGSAQFEYLDAQITITKNKTKDKNK